MPIIGSSASQSGRIPGVATITGVTASDGQVTVAFNEPAYKGKGTVTYTVTSSPSAITATGSSSPIVVAGLTNGTSYTFTVATVGNNGVAASSSASSSVAPVAPRNGYVLGGQEGPTALSLIQKLNMTSETASNLGVGLAAASSLNQGFANSGTAGYSAGNQATRSSTTISKLTFNGESVSAIGATLDVIRSGGVGYANSGNAGYFVGGGNESFNRSQRVEKYAFSNDTRAFSNSIGFTLGEGLGGFANSGSAGYSDRGWDLDSSFVNSSHKLTFSNDTLATMGIVISDANKYYYAGFANSGTAGYIGGGRNRQTSVEYNNIHKLVFSSETRSNLGATLSATSRINLAGFSNNGIAGYWCNGRNFSQGVSVNTVDKLTFSNDTRSTLGTGMASATYAACGYANSGAL